MWSIHFLSNKIQDQIQIEIELLVPAMATITN